MKLSILKIGLLAMFIVPNAFAGAYKSADIKIKEKAPSYHPTKGVSYEDSYHIAGDSWANDRAIASEKEDRKPSSVEDKYEPQPWSYKKSPEVTPH